MKPLKATVGDNPGFLAIKQALETAHAEIVFDHLVVDGELELRTAAGGVRLFWIFEGSGEVFLPEGCRTLEGDGAPLPASYRAEPVDPEFLEALRLLDEHRGTFTPDAWPSIRLILDHRTPDGGFIGDIAGCLWNLEHVARPWSSDPAVEAAVEKLYTPYRTQGWSVKTTGSWENVGVGDQLTVAGDEVVRVRGHFRCLTLEHRGRSNERIPTAMRMPYLLDTSGGCGMGFDPYRRLTLTWAVDAPGARGDGDNFVNAHVVNIDGELSTTHFHPPVVPEGGGIPQTEMYLVLDPKACGIDAKGRRPAILLFPDLRDLSQYEKIDLAPGDLILIPPGVGHRGLDCFVNVLTVPGFKPHNELYIDQHILDATGGASPHNEAALARKNLDRIEDYLLPV